MWLLFPGMLFYLPPSSFRKAKVFGRIAPKVSIAIGIRKVPCEAVVLGLLLPSHCNYSKHNRTVPSEQLRPDGSSPKGTWADVSLIEEWQ